VRTSLRWAVLTLGLVLGGAVGLAQDAPKPAADAKADGAKPPELSELQQTQITAAALTKENWALKLQQAGSEYTKASEALDRLVASLQKPGYTLQQNRETGKLEYVKTPDPPKGDPKKGGGTR
jgi:hypothetical protein